MGLGGRGGGGGHGVQGSRVCNVRMQGKGVRVSVFGVYDSEFAGCSLACYKSIVQGFCSGAWGLWGEGLYIQDWFGLAFVAWNLRGKLAVSGQLKV